MNKIDGVAQSVQLLSNGNRPVLVTGGAGFIGSNIADALLMSGHKVIVYDNLSRPGVERNLEWLKERHGNRVEPVIADVRDSENVREQVARASHVFHFAAQVAVTTSLISPTEDFEINAYGTLNVLEAIRALDEASRPPLLLTSTNKVYGGLEDIQLRETSHSYEPEDILYREFGISEERNLDFHSPYGCSKGAADQYVMDYARSFGLQTVVFRMSCIYGPRQFGTEDQGWVAHFLIQALKGQPITIYGDGKQVRDILYIDDLAKAMIAAIRQIDPLSGQAFNIGGGPNNTISLLDLLDMIDDLNGSLPDVQTDAWRVGDQRYYVSDTREFERVAAWRQETCARDGVRKLWRWLAENQVAGPKSKDRQIAIKSSGAA